MADDSTRLRSVPLPLPRRFDFRAAFDTYVTGRHKAVPANQKTVASAGRSEALPPPAHSDAETSANVRRSPRAGVGIPERLVFHRGAGTWRDRIRRGASQPGVDRD